MGRDLRLPLLGLSLGVLGTLLLLHLTPASRKVTGLPERFDDERPSPGPRASTLPERGQLFFRLRKGDLLYAAAVRESEGAIRVEEDALAAVHATEGTWRRLRLPDKDGRSRFAWIPRSPDRELVASGGGRPAQDPDREVVEIARAVMGERGLETTCGPYDLLAESPSKDRIEACGRLAMETEARFVERFEVRPEGPAQGAVLWFRDRASYRGFLKRRGESTMGHAAQAEPARGVLVFVSQGESGDREARTLVHEMTHLVAYRAFGPDLPRWLSEGLADAIGDTATWNGLRPLDELFGVEAEAKRFAGAYERGETRPLGDLLADSEADFDDDARRCDYEQSALLVRFLLLEGAARAPFQAFLAELSKGRRYAPELLYEHLRASEEELAADFGEWLVEVRRSAHVGS